MVYPTFGPILKALNTKFEGRGRKCAGEHLSKRGRFLVESVQNFPKIVGHFSKHFLAFFSKYRFIFEKDLDPLCSRICVFKKFYPEGFSSAIRN